MDTLLSALRGVAEETRLRILALLGRGELTVSELVQILGQSQPRVSRHLKLMVEAGVLSRFREGTWVFYRLSDDAALRPVLDVILHSLPEDIEQVRDFERLSAIREERSKAASNYFKENAADWDETRKLILAEDQVEAEIKSLITPIEVTSLLDVGTGTGRILELLHDQYEVAIGVDLSLEMLAVARANLLKAEVHNAIVRQGDMYDLPVTASSQSLVIFHQVLHFADNPGRAVCEAARVLQPDGYLIIVDFAPHELEHLREEHAHRRLGFSNDEVSSWAKRASIELVKTKTIKGDQLDVCLWCLRKDDE